MIPRLFLKKLIIAIFAGIDLLILESVIKYFLILNNIPKQGYYLFGGFLQIVFVQNTNLAFSLPLPQILTIILVLIILIALGFFWFKAVIEQKIWHVFALNLIILGALSNLLDRLIFGYVIDYINVFFWPVFNLADAMIVAGVAIYLFNEIFKPKLSVSNT